MTEVRVERVPARKHQVLDRYRVVVDGKRRLGGLVSRQLAEELAAELRAQKNPAVIKGGPYGSTIAGASRRVYESAAPPVAIEH